MDFIESLSKEILEKIAPRLSDAVLQDVAGNLKNELVFRFSEEEAAAKLGIAPATLAAIRKDGLIEFTYSVVPTMDDKGRQHGGRISYLPRHLEEYLARNEIKRFFRKLKAA